MAIPALMALFTAVRDVRVDPTLALRLLNIGDNSLETAGETSRITLPNVDRPR